jgi:glycosyltransferase involved in cell wall biosynthesis
LLRRRGVDLAIVENHLPAAAFIALTSGARVILHTHAYVKAPENAFDGAFRGQEMRALSGFAFVSEYALGQFRADFPGQLAGQRAVPNGLDMQDWSATQAKDRSILCVGRALKHKGHIEAMAAITRALSSHPDWSARFMVSDPAAADLEPETVNALRAAAEPFNGRIRVDSNVPYAEVKAAWERAEVGMVLTTGPEPFGRTALEAMASGAALITSGRGGLAEICGPCAVTVEPSDANGVAAALDQLLDAPDRRAELARAGRERVEALFDIRTISRQMDEFIEACLGEGRGQAQASDPRRQAVRQL